MIKTQKYYTNNMLLTNEVLKAQITNFWQEVFNPIKNNHHLMIMCKVEYTEIEMGYRTLGHLRRVNFEDKERFIEYLISRLGLLTDAYTSITISNITFSYIINEGLATSKDRKLLQNMDDKSLTTHRFNNKKAIISKTIDLITRYIVGGENRTYQIDITLDGNINNVSILDASDLKWIDTKQAEGFKREIGKSTIYFIDGEVVLRKQKLPAKPFMNTKINY